MSAVRFRLWPPFFYRDCLGFPLENPSSASQYPPSRTLFTSRPMSHCLTSSGKGRLYTVGRLSQSQTYSRAIVPIADTFTESPHRRALYADRWANTVGTTVLRFLRLGQPFYVSYGWDNRSTVMQSAMKTPDPLSLNLERQPANDDSNR